MKPLGLHNIHSRAHSELSERQLEREGADLADLFSTPAPVLPSSLDVVCAWCPGFDPTTQRAGVSHGLCKNCAATLNAELDAQAVA
jgi:hypothetical protein